MEDKKAVDARPSCLSRREFCSTALGASLMAMVPPGVRSGAWAAGSDAPEKKEVRIGFIPLTDCASRGDGLGARASTRSTASTIIPTKEASWAGVRDKLVNGELDAAHVLYGLIYGVHLGVGGPKKDMAVLMGLNNNGQAITLSNSSGDKGAIDGASLARLMARKEREYTFAQTFPTGTHAMWLYYWLAAAGHQPAVRMSRPSPCRRRRWWPTCAWATWTASAWASRGTTAPSWTASASRPTTTQDIWTDHPEKVLGTTAELVQKYPNTARAVVMAILDAGQLDRRQRWPTSRRWPKPMADKAYVNTGAEVIDAAHPRPLPERPGQELGRHQPHEVLQRRGGELPLPVGRHVVPDPAQALGPAQEPPGLPGRGQAGQPDRPVQAGCRQPPASRVPKDAHAHRAS